MKTRHEILDISEEIFPERYKIHEKIKEVIKKHNLSETEVSALIYETLGNINVVFCEVNIRLGIERRKAERETDRKYNCKDCNREVRQKAVTTWLGNLKLCPQCYTKRNKK